MSSKSATITWLAEQSFQAETDSGYTLTLDSGKTAAEQGRGPSPMELLLLGLGGCTGIDVVMILGKMRQEVTAYQVRVSGARADEPPRVYTSMTVEHIVTGRKLDPAAVRRAVELSETRYCSAAAMLSQAAPITTTIRLIDADTGSETLLAPKEAHA